LELDHAQEMSRRSLTSTYQQILLDYAFLLLVEEQLIQTPVSARDVSYLNLVKSSKRAFVQGAIS
jgi:hypothetical protein